MDQKPDQKQSGPEGPTTADLIQHCEEMGLDARALGYGVVIGKRNQQRMLRTIKRITSDGHKSKP